MAVSVAVERPDGEGGWLVGVTRGTTLGTEHAKSRTCFLDPYSCYRNILQLC